MSRTAELTNMAPEIAEFQNSIRAKYELQNKTAKKGQILFVGSSLMEIFPIERMQQERKELTFDGAHMLPNGYEIVLANMKKYLQPGAYNEKNT